MLSYLKLSLSDFKLIFRDKTLQFFLLMPLLVFAVLNLFLPYLVAQFPVVEDYVSFVVIVATIEVTQMFGFIYAMVLIDEKETQVSKVYGVLPVSKIAYVLSRFILPVLITILITWLILLVQPFYDLSPALTLVFSVLSGLIVPVYSISVAILSKNRMEGMVWIKVFNLIVIIPIAAFFLPKAWTWLMAIFPTYWAFQSLDDLIVGQAFWMNYLIGFAFLMLLTMLAARRFAKVHFA